MRYYGHDVPSLRSYDTRGDTVIHAGTFSKSYSPGIRVGWGILPAALLKPLLSLKGHLDFGSPHFNQVLMHTVMELGLFERHVLKVREAYRAKLDHTLVAAADVLGPIPGVSWLRPRRAVRVGPSAGGHRRRPGRPALPTGRGRRRVVRAGPVLFSAARPRPSNVLRLSFGIPSAAEIRRGIEALGRAIRQVL